MIVYNNKSDLTNVYLGNVGIAKVYVGTHQVYPNSIPPTPTFDGKYKLTLSNGDVISAACDGTSAITRNEISAYSQTCVSAVVGDCVTTISNTAFGYFHNLSSLTISDSVVNIYGYAFAHCFSLTSIGDKGSGASIELPTGLTTIEDSAFEYCTGLTSVSIPSSITSIGYAAFGDCTSLQSIYIPSSVTSIEGYAFANCSGLTSIIVNATVPPSSNGATSNWYAFEGSTCQILVPCESINSYMSASGWANYASRLACIPTHEYVDLGLPSGTKWATMNVGASSETDYGNYYQYGNGADDYQVTSGQSEYEGTENPLAASADTATQLWGGQWHMPTSAQCQELIDNTTCTWETNFNGSGVTGAKFTSNSDNTKYVFFPSSGYLYNGSGDYVGERCCYITSTPDDEGSSNSRALSVYYITPVQIFIKEVDKIGRNAGTPVRPVIG